MENTLQVNDQQLMIKEYQGQRVVHMWDIAKLHDTTVKHIRMNFENNKNHLVENEDYFLIEKTDDLLVNLIDQSDISRHAVYRSKNIPIFTESGYLMMTKPMTDEISWKVQRTLVNCYFKVKEVMKEPKIKDIKPQLKSLSEVNKTIEIISNMYDKMGVSNKDKVKTINVLLATTGVNLPSIDVVEKLDKSDFITISELAGKVGIYDKYSRPNVEALAIVMESLKLNSSNYRISMHLDADGNEAYYMAFSPNLVKRISNWLYDRNYPTFLESQLNNGNIRRVMIVYRDKDFTIH